MNTSSKMPRMAESASKMPGLTKSVKRMDRPGWIPPEITHGWDTDPYAYQTEEELMPAGGLHGKILAHIMEILRDFLEKRGLMLLLDTFMLYRDRQGIKRRIAPDLLLMPFRSSPPSAYDLDTEPLPLCVVKVTSPGNRIKDLKNNVRFYSRLGISTYLAIDAITARGKLRKQIELHLWRKTKRQMRKLNPDSKGFLRLPELKVKVKAEGQHIVFADILTDEVLPDMGQLSIENDQLNAENKHLQAEIVRLKALLDMKT